MKKKRTFKSEVLTLPNLLSLLRLILIPVIVYFYVGKDMPLVAVVLLAVSGITDIVDGYVARHFNMISDFGKMLDPIADKLTQLAMLFCLASKFPMMLIPFYVLIAKEVISLIIRIVLFRRSGDVYGAEWHGKAATVLLYASIIVHILWLDIPSVVSSIIIVLSIVMMMVSFGVYTFEIIVKIRNEKIDSIIS